MKRTIYLLNGRWVQPVAVWGHYGRFVDTPPPPSRVEMVMADGQVISVRVKSVTESMRRSGRTVLEICGEEVA